MRKEIELKSNDETHNMIYYIVLFIFAFIVLGITFIFVFQLPYTGDDRMNSLAKGVVMTSDQNVWQNSYGIQKLWTDAGRFFPLGYYSLPLFYFMPDLLSYRIFQFLLNYIVITVFACLIYQVSKKWQLAFFSVLMVPVFFQIRNYHDAITGFHGLLQFVMLFFLLAILFQTKAVEKRFILYSILSGLFYLCSLLLYEIAFSFIAVFIIISLLSYKNWKQRIYGICAQAAAIILVMIPTIYFKSNATREAYEGIQTSFDFGKIISTFAIQFTAAIPLSSQKYTFDSIFQSLHQQIRTMSAFKLFSISFFLLSAVGIFIFSIRKCNQIETQNGALPISSKKEQDTRILRNLFYVGLSLMIFPAGLLSLSIRYQEELVWGLGYLPVYIQYFGGICVSGAVLFFLFEKINKRSLQAVFSGIITLFLCALFILTQAQNVTTRNDIIQTDSQMVSQYVLESNLFDDLESNARLFIVQGGVGSEMYPEHFVIQYANGHEIPWGTQAELLAEKNMHKAENNQITIFPENLYVFYAFGNVESGVALLAKAEKIVFSTDEKTLFKDSIQEVYYTQGKGMYFGNEEGNLLLQIENAGATEDINIQVKNLFSGAEMEQVTDISSTVHIKIISDIFSPSSFDRHFTPRREKSFQFQVRSENGQLRLRGLKT